MKAFRIIAAFAVCLFLALGVISLASSASSDQVRIGLESQYLNVSSIPFLNSELEFGFESGSFNSCGNISSSNGFTVTIAGGNYYMADEEFSTLKKAQDYIEAEEINAIPALVDFDEWRVYLEIDDSEDEYEEVTLSGYAVVLNANSSPCIIFDNPALPPQFRAVDNNEIIKLASKDYRGCIEARRSGGTITAVSVLSLEEYLYSCVPSEMPSGWNAEALKAQAVACRTYICVNKGKHNAYDLCDNQHCQQYNGYASEKATSTAAVDATKGQKAYYKGALINALYFSSSGGYTANAIDVWSMESNYLFAVKEINEIGAKEWSRSFTYDELTKIAKINGYNIGEVTNVTITDTAEGGRVNELTITGTEGVKVLTKEETRTFCSSSSEGTLSSRMYTLNTGSSEIVKNTVYVRNEFGKELFSLDVFSVATKDDICTVSNSNSIAVKGKNDSYIFKASALTEVEKPDSVIFTGTGWGHGVGMSQFGAKGMADRGYSYKDILKHYYQGITIK